MTTKFGEYVNVAEKLEALGCTYPTGLALLPSNFETATAVTDFRQASSASTIKTLWRNAGIAQSDIIDRSSRPPFIKNNSFEWIGPTLFVSATLWSSDPNAVSVGLGLLANYVTDFFKGMPGQRVLKMEIVVERNKSKSCKRISYEGPPEGLKDLAKIIKAASDE